MNNELRVRFRWRPIDSQRQKVYSLECRLFVTAYATPLLDTQVGLQLHQAARRFRITQPAYHVKHRQSSLTGRYNQRTGITLYTHTTGPAATVRLGTVLHEFSHHLCRQLYGDEVAWHGPEFFRCLLEVMKWAGHYRGRYSQGRHRVKVASNDHFWKLVRGLEGRTACSR
jgi:hypothetical protein